MLEDNLLDEEIKKKKRGVLIVLLVLLFLGALATFPLAQLAAPSPTTVAQLTSTATPIPPTTSVPATATQRPPEPSATNTAMPTLPSATASPTPLITGETPAAVGGGTTSTPSEPPDQVASETPESASDESRTGMESASTGIGGPTPTGELGEETPDATPTDDIGGETSAATPGAQVKATETAEETTDATLAATDATPAPLRTPTTPAPEALLPVTGGETRPTQGWLAAGLVMLLLGAGVSALRNKLESGESR
ncbi:MAG: hypothetical protein JSV81_14025 [Anaerolineales bacterium]|nr:MAG: hypothetical protein JSV81_14025 [Anaerolineales bacterium]